MLATDHIRKRGGGTGGGGATNGSSPNGLAIPQGNQDNNGTTTTTTIRKGGNMKRRKRVSSSGNGSGGLATIRYLKMRINRWLRRARINPQQFFAYAIGAFFVLIFILVCSTFIIYHRVANSATDNPKQVGVGVLGPSEIMKKTNGKHGRHAVDASASSAGSSNKSQQQLHQKIKSNNNSGGSLPVFQGNLPIPSNIHQPLDIMISAFTYPHLSKATIQQLFYIPENYGHYFTDDKDDKTPNDHGGLDIKFFAESNAARPIYNDKEFELNGLPPNTIDEEAEEHLDEYYAFDDDGVRRDWLVTTDATEFHRHTGTNCRRTADHRLHFPTCNRAHEEELLDAGVTYIGEGAYRQVFIVYHDSGEEDLERLVIKDLQAHEVLNHEMMEVIRMDALVAERLTSSPRIYDIYGFCGLSIMSEFFHHGDVEPMILEGDPPGYSKTLTRDDPNKISPTSQFSPIQKLVLSLEMAKGVAELHGYKNGLIIHDDIQLSQYLFNEDKSIVILNDFNRAEFPLYDDVSGEYCRYYNGKGHGNWRSPEEYRDGPITEAIDIWSLGCNFHSILTGLYPHYTIVHNYKKYIKHLMEGNIPEMDPRYKTRSKEEGILFGIVEKCWMWDAADRPSVFDLVEMLQKAVDEHMKPGETIAKVLKSIDSSEWDWIQDEEDGEKDN